MFSILGKLPASDSEHGTLNKLDLQKTIRMAIVVLAGAFIVAFGGSVGSAGDLSAINWQTVLGDAFQAGISALGAAALELIRRFLVNQSA